MLKDRFPSGTRDSLHRIWRADQTQSKRLNTIRALKVQQLSPYERCKTVRFSAQPEEIWGPVCIHEVGIISLGRQVREARQQSADEKHVARNYKMLPTSNILTVLQGHHERFLI